MRKILLALSVIAALGAGIAVTVTHPSVAQAACEGCD